MRLEGSDVREFTGHPVSRVVEFFSSDTGINTGVAAANIFTAVASKDSSYLLDAALAVSHIAPAVIPKECPKVLVALGGVLSGLRMLRNADQPNPMKVANVCAHALNFAKDIILWRHTPGSALSGATVQFGQIKTIIVQK
jgi:hypothetical protein